MKKRKKFLDLIPLMLAWAVFSVIFWGWIFTFLTDTAPENKIVLYVDGEVADPTAFALAMEKCGAEGIKMVQARPFTYAMMADSGLDRADLYIVPASHAEEYGEWFAQGEPVLVHDPAGGVSVAAAFIAYADEVYYLYYGKDSVHLEDGLAQAYAAHLLTIR